MPCRLGPTRRRTIRVTVALLAVLSLFYYGAVFLNLTYRSEASIERDPLLVFGKRIQNFDHDRQPTVSVGEKGNIKDWRPLMPPHREGPQTPQRAGGDTSVIDLHSNASVQTIPLVLIVSMMRSGTTFTGEVFRSYPESFYLFEPMQFLTNNIGINNITFVNGTTRFYDRSQLHELHAVTIINLLLCRFESVPVGVFKTSHFLYHNHLKQFYNCVRGLRDDDANMGGKCIPYLRQKCEKASSRVFKLITVRMEAISHVMKLLPEVYVIHLVRDPRGALLSQINVGQVDKSKIGNESESHCSNLKKDVAVTKRDICFRRNFHRQRYEDLAREPLEQFSGLFEFVNMKFHQFVQSRIRSIAMAKGVVRKCLYCSDKGDAQAASQRWRGTAHFSTVTEIQKQCAGVMAELGYIQVNSTTHLKDTNVSLTL